MIRDRAECLEGGEGTVSERKCEIPGAQKLAKEGNSVAKERIRMAEQCSSDTEDKMAVIDGLKCTDSGVMVKMTWT